MADQTEVYVLRLTGGAPQPKHANPVPKQEPPRYTQLEAYRRSWPSFPFWSFVTPRTA